MTRPISAGLHDDPDVAGLRWWSAFSGDWHTVVLFSDRVGEGAFAFSPPEPLPLDSPEVARAAAALGIELRAG